MMELTKYMINGVTAMAIRGQLTGGLAQLDTFHEFFRSLVVDGETDVIVNLSETTWASSQGIGMLIGAYTSARKTGGMVVLTNVNERIRNTLDVTRLCLLLRSFGADDEAAKYLLERSGEVLLA